MEELYISQFIFICYVKSWFLVEVFYKKNYKFFNLIKLRFRSIQKFWPKFVKLVRIQILGCY